MKNYTGYIIDYSDGNLSDRKRKWFEGELAQNVEVRNEYYRFKQVNDFMRGKHDLEEVRNDPDRQNIDSVAKQMISEFHENPNQYKSIRKFVETSLNEGDPELQRKLDQTKLEAEKHHVNEITGKWVEEWDSKNQTGDAATESRRAFISSALNNEGRNNGRSTKRSNTNALRIALLAAAAMIAAIVLVKTLNPSESSEELYQKYYRPLVANTATTRNSSNIDPFSGAVELYKQGQYKAAAATFSDLLYKDSNSVSIRFFSGITLLELGDYNQAIVLLNEVATKNMEYKKEAQWYLGLAYLKLGETQKATTCIEKLAESKGYYQDQAQDLLSRLK
jgi:tetratricopeptide (TPR) repeat protein